MSFTLQVTVDGQHELDLAFSRAADTLNDLTKYWPAVADVFYEIEREQFQTEGARGGAKWAALSPAYAEWKARWLERETFDSKNQLLRLKGDLYRSLTSRGGKAGLIADYADNSIYDPKSDSLTLGSTLPYATAHQRGTSKMPARPPIQFQPTDARRFQRAFRDEVAKEVKRAGWPDLDLSSQYADVIAAGNAIDEDVSMF